MEKMAMLGSFRSPGPGTQTVRGAFPWSCNYSASFSFLEVTGSAQLHPGFPSAGLSACGEWLLSLPLFPLHALPQPAASAVHFPTTPLGVCN